MIAWAHGASFLSSQNKVVLKQKAHEYRILEQHLKLNSSEQRWELSFKKWETSQYEIETTEKEINTHTRSLEYDR